MTITGGLLWPNPRAVQPPNAISPAGTAAVRPWRRKILLTDSIILKNIFLTSKETRKTGLSCSIHRRSYFVVRQIPATLLLSSVLGFRDTKSRLKPVLFLLPLQLVNLLLLLELLQLLLTLELIELLPTLGLVELLFLSELIELLFLSKLVLLPIELELVYLLLPII